MQCSLTEWTQKPASHLKRTWVWLVSTQPKINWAKFSKNNFKILVSQISEEGKETDHDSPLGEIILIFK